MLVARLRNELTDRENMVTERKKAIEAQLRIFSPELLVARLRNKLTDREEETIEVQRCVSSPITCS